MTDAPDEGTAPPELVRAITDALSAATDDDDTRLHEVMERIADIDFPAGLAFACYSWARITAAASMGSPVLLAHFTEGGFHAGVQFLGRDGALVNAEDTDAVTRFVGRTVACAFNDDHAAALDLWQALDPDLWAQCAVDMVRVAARAVAARRGDHAGGTLP